MRDDLIYDIGLHNGDDTAYYLHKGWRVVAVEADPLLVEQARRRFASEMAEGRLTLLNVAVADHEGVARFWICEHGREWSSLHHEWASQIDGAHEVEVPCTRLATILREHGVPHYLKIDIEGGEEHCLADLSPDNLPTYLSVEMTDLPTLMRIYNLGYDLFKCVDQATKSAIPFPPRRRSLKQALQLQVANHPKLRNLLREAHRRTSLVKAQVTRHDPRSPSGPSGDDWHFSLASSGPFGKELPGPWQTVEEAAVVWLTEWSRVGYPPPANRRDIWIDLHATRGSIAAPQDAVGLTHSALGIR